MEYTQELRYNKIQQEMNPKILREHNTNQPKMSEAHINMVEAHINRIYSQNNQQTTHATHNQHSSIYAKTHPYHHNTQATNSSQNISAHNQHQTTQHATNHTIQPVATVCSRCGNKNPPATNYCHQCGYGLK